MKMVKYIVMIILIAMTIVGCSSTEYISKTNNCIVRTDHRIDAPVEMTLSFGHHGKVEEIYGEGENAWYKIGSKRWVSAKDCEIEPEKVKRLKNIVKDITILPEKLCFIKKENDARYGLDINSKEAQWMGGELVKVLDGIYDEKTDNLVLIVTNYGYELDDFFVSKAYCDFESKDKIERRQREIDFEIKI